MICIGDESFRIERRWREAGAKGKVFVEDEGMPAKDFQHWLMEKLGIPLVNFPKGNPMSGQTWPELSFRTLLRHIFRQQRFWSGLVDQQPDNEQHASLLLFLGLAERIYSDDYGALVELKLKSMRVRARRDHYRETLNDLAVELLDSDDAKPGDNPGYDAEAKTRLTPYDIMRVASRYFIDEYPREPHTGVGMFGATPVEKLDEVLELYDGVEAPVPENRIIQLGLKRTVSTTSEGILFDGIPYTSPELNLFSDGKAKKVDVYLDPDFLGTVIVLPRGTKQKIEAKLSYSAYADLTYFQAKQLMKVAAQGKPKKREQSNKDLLEAKRRRALESGFYPDPNCHESYMSLPRYEKQAEANAQIGPNKGTPRVQTTKPGSITDRPKKDPPKSAKPHSTAPQAPTSKSRGGFAPITKSKL